MVDFLRGEPHANAMRAEDQLGHGTTLGWECETRPNWDTALARWTEANLRAEHPI
ncbi:MAG: hypothetical protein AAFR35_14115 [Pseudomonadota bacterium]